MFNGSTMPVLLLLLVVVYFSVVSLTWWYNIQSHKIHLLVVEKIWSPGLTVDIRCKVKFIDFGPRINLSQAFQLKGVRGMVVAMFQLPSLQGLDIWIWICLYQKVRIFWLLCSLLDSETHLVLVAEIRFGPALFCDGINSSGLLSSFKLKLTQSPLANLALSVNHTYEVEFLFK